MNRLSSCLKWFYVVFLIRSHREDIGHTLLCLLLFPQCWKSIRIFEKSIIFSVAYLIAWTFITILGTWWLIFLIVLFSWIRGFIKFILYRSRRLWARLFSVPLLISTKAWFRFRDRDFPLFFLQLLAYPMRLELEALKVSSLNERWSSLTFFLLFLALVHLLIIVLSRQSLYLVLLHEFVERIRVSVERFVYLWCVLIVWILCVL